MYKVCVIGCGVSGTLLILKLLETIAPKDICVIDPWFDGGDLGRRWSDVYSNTTWQQFIDSMGKLSMFKQTIEIENPSGITPLACISNSLKNGIKPYLRDMDANSTTAKKAEYSSEKDEWKITLCNGDIRYAKTLVYTPGGNPKTVSLGKHQMPLEIALDLTRLKRVINVDDKVLLFGLSHSGSLVLKNLLKLNIKVSVIYKSTEPFIFARDGVYNGIKQESAIFADEFLRTQPNELCTLINSSEIDRCIKAYNNADTIISATGFIKNTTSTSLYMDNILIDASKYDHTNAVIEDAPHTFGFGISYPSKTLYNGRLYEDVGVSTFVNHIIYSVPKIIEDIHRI